MNAPLGFDKFYIGWDVGGWNCDKNASSRDAVVILDAKLSLVGTPWRGNLRTHINNSSDSSEFIQGLFLLCGAHSADPAQVTLAIDTPLGFSTAFVGLITEFNFAEPLQNSGTNHYLFRQSERYLFDHGITPLSAIKDMIGSQATKGIHVLAKFAPRGEGCGVWSDGGLLTAIEAYPSACKRSQLIQGLLGRYMVGVRFDSQRQQWIDSINHQDKLDALTCALVAHLYNSRPDTLAQPPDSIPKSEGWIWVPADALNSDARRHILVD